MLPFVKFVRTEQLESLAKMSAADSGARLIPFVVGTGMGPQGFSCFGYYLLGVSRAPPRSLILVLVLVLVVKKCSHFFVLQYPKDGKEGVGGMGMGHLLSLS